MHSGNAPKKQHCTKEHTFGLLRHFVLAKIYRQKEHGNEAMQIHNWQEAEGWNTAE